MSQRAAGDRARWLSAMLIVAAIAATSVIVRFWGVDAVAPPLASRQIRLYEVPVTPVSMMVSLPAAQASPPLHPPSIRSVRLQEDGVSPAEPGPSASVSPAEAGHFVPMKDGVQEIVAAAVPAAAPVVESPTVVNDPVTAVDTDVPDDIPVVAVAQPAPPVPASSHGLVELPAIAVTRAVTVAGRGIISGLRATGALVRAAF